jgi:uncharacterized protein YmfQ (DUF2313 family)
MTDFFKTPPLDGTAQQMADSIPQGRAWGSKNIEGSNERKLITSLAAAHNRVQQQIELLSGEFNILQTVELLPDWEESVGLPSTCFGLAETIEQRREQVIQRLRKQPVVTRADFQDFLDGLFPELGVEVIPGSEYFTFEYDLEATLIGELDEKFILVVKVPISGDQLEYDLEYDLTGGPNTDQLECVLRKITPCNVLIIIEFVG